MYTSGFSVVKENEKLRLKLNSINGLELLYPYTVSYTTKIDENIYGSYETDDNLLEKVINILMYCERFVNKRSDIDCDNIAEYAIWESNNMHRGYIVIEDINENKYRIFYFSKRTTTNPFQHNVRKFIFEEINRDLKFKRSEVDIKLDAISELKDNWNENGASAFSSKLIQKCRSIAKYLPQEPFIAPTATNSIQFEYEKENGDYLEFQIYEDKVEVYSKISSDEKEFELSGDSILEKMKQIIVDFYK